MAEKNNCFLLVKIVKEEHQQANVSDKVSFEILAVVTDVEKVRSKMQQLVEDMVNQPVLQECISEWVDDSTCFVTTRDNPKSKQYTVTTFSVVEMPLDTED